MKQIKRICAVVLAMLLIVTAIPLNNTEAAVKKPTIAKSATVKVKKSVTKKITKNGWTIKSVKVKKYSKKGIVTAKATKKSVKFTGKKKGTATVYLTVKAKKSKKAKKTKTFTLKTKVTVKKADKSSDESTPEPEPTASEKATVATQEEITNALKESSLKELTISTTASTEFTLDGDHSKVALIVNAPNADVTNSAKWKSVTIQAIKDSTWHELAINNVFTVTAKKARIIAESGSQISSVTVATPNGTKASDSVIKIEAVERAEIRMIEVASSAVKVETKAEGSGSSLGTVEVKTAQADVSAKAENGAKVRMIQVAESASGAKVAVEANGTGKVSSVKTEAKADISVGGTNKTASVQIEVAKTAEGTKVEATTKVDVTNAAKGVEVDAKNGAAGSTVKTTGDGDTKAVNTSGGSITVTDKDNKDTTVANNTEASTNSNGGTDTKPATQTDSGSGGGGGGASGGSGSSTGKTDAQKLADVVTALNNYIGNLNQDYLSVELSDGQGHVKYLTNAGETTSNDANSAYRSFCIAHPSTKSSQLTALESALKAYGKPIKMYNKFGDDKVEQATLTTVAGGDGKSTTWDSVQILMGTGNGFDLSTGAAVTKELFFAAGDDAYKLTVSADSKSNDTVVESTSFALTKYTPVLQSIAVTTQPKLRYKTSQKFNADGIVVIGTYDTGKTATIAVSDLAFTMETPSTTFTSGTTSMTTEMDGKKITVTYGGKSTETDNIEVKDSFPASGTVTLVKGDLTALPKVSIADVAAAGTVYIVNQDPTSMTDEAIKTAAVAKITGIAKNATVNNQAVTMISGKSLSGVNHWAVFIPTNTTELDSVKSSATMFDAAAATYLGLYENTTYANRATSVTGRVYDLDMTVADAAIEFYRDNAVGHPVYVFDQYGTVYKTNNISPVTAVTATMSSGTQTAQFTATMSVDERHGCIFGGIQANQAEPNATALKFTLLGCEFTVTQKEVVPGTYTVTNVSNKTITANTISIPAGQSAQVTGPDVTFDEAQTAGTNGQYLAIYAFGDDPTQNMEFTHFQYGYDYSSGTGWGVTSLYEDVTVNIVDALGLTKLEANALVGSARPVTQDPNDDSLHPEFFSTTGTNIYGYTIALKSVGGGGTASFNTDTRLISGNVGDTVDVVLCIKDNNENELSTATYTLKIVEIGSRNMYYGTLKTDWS